MRLFSTPPPATVLAGANENQLQTVANAMNTERPAAPPTDGHASP